MKNYVKILLLFSCFFVIKNTCGQSTKRFDKNALLKQVLILGCENCNLDFHSASYCNQYDSVCSKKIEKLSDPENIAVLAWENVWPLKSKIGKKFKHFGFLDSFSSYFEFIDTIPSVFYFKDISEDEFIGFIMPGFPTKFCVNLMEGAYGYLDKTFFDRDDMFIIANLSNLLSISELYEGEWYLEGEKLFINIEGKKVSAREYFEKNINIKKVKWSRIINKTR